MTDNERNRRKLKIDFLIINFWYLTDFFFINGTDKNHLASLSCIITIMDPAVFLDRDGVIVENRDGYVRSWKDVEFLSSSLEALKLLNRSIFKVIIVTNQSVIGRGIISETQAWEINQQIISVICSAGGRVDGLYLCPHIPEDHCLCRKPQPGLILQAAEKLSLDLSSSVVIGDALTDIHAGQNAGIKRLFLVKTGRGRVQHHLSQPTQKLKYEIAENLFTAVDVILTRSFG